MPGEMTVPTDWTEEDGYRIGIIFFPDSLQWLANVHGALYTLTRGRAYDFDTGYFKGIEAEAEKVWGSFMSGNLLEITSRMDEFTKTQRMIVAALMGQAINFDSEPLPNAINYENGIRQAILSVGGTLGGDMTLAELIALMEAQDGPDYGFKDWLEILRLFQELFNGAGLLPVAAIGGLITAIFSARSNHNTLALQAMQATALRGIQNAIAPPKDPVTEETTVQSWMDTLEKIPFLTTAIVAIVDPSPTGEGAMAVKIALTIRNLMDKAFGWIADWWNTYVETVGNPQPAGTVVGMLSEISRKVQSLADETATPTVTVSNRLKAISDAIEGIETQGVDVTPTLVDIVTALNGIALPEGTTWAGLFAELAVDLGEEMAVTVNVTCSSCGSSGGCGCGGSGSGAYGPGVEGPEDSPPVVVGTGNFPIGFPDLPSYQDYKCKAANVIVLNIAELMAQISDFQDTDLSQYSILQSAIDWIVYKIRLLSPGISGQSDAFLLWLSNRISGFVWPFPNEQASDLSVFSDVRLDYLNDRQDAVCELYTSDNTGDARTAIETRIDGYIDATSYSSGVKSTAKEMYKGLLSNQFLSRLFQKDTLTSNYNDASAIDCSLCGGEVVFGLYQPPGQTGVWGSLERVGDHYSGSSQLGNDCNRFNVRAVITGTLDPACLTITNINVVGATHTTGFDFWEECGTLTIVACPSNDVVNIEGECAHALILCSDTPFTIEFDTEFCEP
jgi:hypothetical protein